MEEPSHPTSASTQEKKKRGNPTWIKGKPKPPGRKTGSKNKMTKDVYKFWKETITKAGGEKKWQKWLDENQDQVWTKRLEVIAKLELARKDYALKVESMGKTEEEMRKTPITLDFHF